MFEMAATDRPLILATANLECDFAIWPFAAGAGAPPHQNTTATASASIIQQYSRQGGIRTDRRTGRRRGWMPSGLNGVKEGRRMEFLTLRPGRPG